MKEKIQSGKTYLGIELGSTRIKACLIDDCYTPVASGSYEWENHFENGYWTYSLDEIHAGIQGCFADLSAHIQAQYGVTLTTVGAMGISGMMHGYLAFDRDDKLLVPFRTWRNTTTEDASKELSDLFRFSIPQRWSIAHLYQAVLNREQHIPQVAHITTLAGYIHYLLTGKRELGIGEASGMFPITGDSYDTEMLAKINSAIKEKGYSLDVSLLLPTVKKAGDSGTVLSEAGAKFLDPKGNLKAGIPLCPPEGDAGTGMVATNSVLPKTGNISAGTSIFAMLVLEKSLSRAYEEIDIATTPDGTPVAMVHCNNCSAELDAWVKIFGEFAALLGADADKSAIYELLYKHALSGDANCGKVTAYNYLSGEHITGVTKGRPLYFRQPDSQMNLANFMRAQLYSAIATLKLGMNILLEQEGVKTEQILAHGGLFKTEGVAQQILADALNTPVSVMQTAGEGGAWGMALLAAYMMNQNGKNLGDWLSSEVFSAMETSTLLPDENGSEGFLSFLHRYGAGIPVQRAFAEI